MPKYKVGDRVRFAWRGFPDKVRVGTILMVDEDAGELYYLVKPDGMLKTFLMPDEIIEVVHE